MDEHRSGCGSSLSCLRYAMASARSSAVAPLACSCDEISSARIVSEASASPSIGLRRRTYGFLRTAKPLRASTSAASSLPRACNRCARTIAELARRTATMLRAESTRRMIGRGKRLTARHPRATVRTVQVRGGSTDRAGNSSRPGSAAASGVAARKRKTGRAQPPAGGPLEPPMGTRHQATTVLDHYLHHCCSHGTPSLFPSILVPGQFLKK